MKKIIRTNKGAAPLAPISKAVLADRTLYISGQVGRDPEMAQLRDGVEAQTRQAMENMGDILEAAGMTFADVVKLTVLMADINDSAKVNAVYKTFFTGDYPARAAYQVARLPVNARVEIEGVAFKSTSSL